MKIHEQIVKTVQKYSYRDAFIWEGERLSFQQLLDSATQLSFCLERNMRVAVCMRNPLLLATTYLSVLLSGGALVLVSDKTPLENIRDLVEFTRSDLLLTDLGEILSAQGWPIPVYQADKSSPHKVHSVRSNILENEAVLLCTSGSTSYPKVVRLSHEGLIHIAQAHNEHLHLQPGHRALITLPVVSSFVHTTQFLSQLLLGGTSIIYNGIFIPGKIYQLIRQYEVESIGCVPTQLRLLIKSPPSGQDTASLKYLISAGDHASISEMAAISQRFPNTRCLRAYGLTEAGPRVTCVHPDQVASNDSCGRPLKGIKLRIISESGGICGCNEIGEICVQSPGNMIDYYNNDSATKSAFTDGFLRTGDIGYLGPNGDLIIVGRKKNVIVSGGRTLFVEEMEETIRSIDQVKDCAVVGEEDRWLGEVPVVYIVISDDSTLETVVDRIKMKIIPDSRPRKVYLISAIPRNETGKIDREAMCRLQSKMVDKG